METFLPTKITTATPPPSPPPPQTPPSPPPPHRQPNTLKVLSANVQSLPPKIDELIALTKIEHFDIFGLNETWLYTLDKHLLAEVSIQGYKIFSVDKPTPSKRGGGSIMYVKNSLNPIEKKSMAIRA